MLPKKDILTGFSKACPSFFYLFRHSYALLLISIIFFVAHDGDIVKLYDLTTLCCNDDDDDAKTSEPVENPFTIPVGVLFYRLARNLRIRQKCPSRGKKAMVVRQLLQNSLLLLEPCKHYQVYSFRRTT